jgi:hypothetical protein
MQNAVKMRRTAVIAELRRSIADLGPDSGLIVSLFMGLSKVLWAEVLTLDFDRRTILNRARNTPNALIECQTNSIYWLLAHFRAWLTGNGFLPKKEYHGLPLFLFCAPPNELGFYGAPSLIGAFSEW